MATCNIYGQNLTFQSLEDAILAICPNDDEITTDNETIEVDWKNKLLTDNKGFSRPIEYSRSEYGDYLFFLGKSYCLMEDTESGCRVIDIPVKFYDGFESKLTMYSDKLRSNPDPHQSELEDLGLHIVYFQCANADIRFNLRDVFIEGILHGDSRPDEIYQYIDKEIVKTWRLEKQQKDHVIFSDGKYQYPICIVPNDHLSELEKYQSGSVKDIEDRYGPQGRSPLYDLSELI